MVVSNMHGSVILSFRATGRWGSLGFLRNLCYNGAVVFLWAQDCQAAAHTEETSAFINNTAKNYFS